MRKLLLLLAVFCCFHIHAQDQLYKVSLLRAKPGSLLEVIDIIKADVAAYQDYSEEKPYLLRHSQGDHWDLMLLYPIESLDEYFSKKNTNNRLKSKSLERPYGDDFHNLISSQEEAIVSGPSIDKFNRAFENYNLFHIEIFTALAGKQLELLKQRQNENKFYAFINHRPNFIFTRVFGPSWDILTIGWYTDMHDFAGPEVSFEDEDKAAKSAGFEGVNYIGSYLRSLLLEHHDTLAGKVK